MCEKATNTPKTVLVDSLAPKCDEYRGRNMLVMITLFWSPEDYPERFVARMFTVSNGAALATPYVVLGDSREEVEKGLPSGMVALHRDSSDHPSIVCTWI